MMTHIQQIQKAIHYIEDHLGSEDLDIDAIAKEAVTFEYLNHLYKGLNMTPQFKTLPEFKVIGFSKPFISILSPEKK